MMIALSAPLAAASSVAGTFDAHGSIEVPAHALITSRPYALFVGDALEGTLEGHAEVAGIRVFEIRYVTADAGVVRPSLVMPTSRETSWTAYDATFSTMPNLPGWIGVRPLSAQLNEQSPGRVEITREEETRMGNGVSGSDAPQNAWFLVTHEGPALARAAEQWSLTGGFSAKIFGPTVTIKSQENSTIIETGEWNDSAAPGQIVRRWIIVDVNAGTMQATEATTRVASPDAAISFDGEAEITNASGTLHDQFEEWRAEGNATSIDGALSILLTPTSGPGRLSIEVTGDLRASTMRSRVAFPASPDTPVGLGILIAVGVLVGSAGTAYRFHQRRPHGRSRACARVDAESVAALAERAADEGDFKRAAHLLDQARRDIPTSRRLALDHAFYVSEAGEDERALRLLEDPLVRDDPDALLLATRLHARIGNMAQAEESIVRALDAAPSLALDIEGDPAYARVIARERVRTALRRARMRLT